MIGNSPELSGGQKENVRGKLSEEILGENRTIQRRADYGDFEAGGKWRAKYGGMDASMVSQMKAMEAENRRLKRMYAEMIMQNDLLKETLGKKR